MQINFNGCSRTKVRTHIDRREDKFFAGVLSGAVATKDMAYNKRLSLWM